jgi:hypothetical protein
LTRYCILILFCCLCSISEAQVPQPPDSAVSLENAMMRLYEDEPRWLISASAGFGYRLARLPDGLNSIEKEYYRDLKTGYYYEADVTYFLKSNFGLGLLYNSIKSENKLDNVTVTGPPGFSGTGTVSDDITITYYGARGSFRTWNNNHNGFANLTFGLGYISYVDKARVINTYKITGETLGLSLGASYLISLSPDFWIGVHGSYTAGVLTEYDFDDGKNVQTIELPDGEGEGLHHVDIGLRIAISF